MVIEHPPLQTYERWPWIDYGLQLDRCRARSLESLLASCRPSQGSREPSWSTSQLGAGSKFRLPSLHTSTLEPKARCALRKRWDPRCL